MKLHAAEGDAGITTLVNEACRNPALLIFRSGLIVDSCLIFGDKVDGVLERFEELARTVPGMDRQQPSPGSARQEAASAFNACRSTSENSDNMTSGTCGK